MDEVEIYRQLFKAMLSNLQTQLVDVREDDMFKRPGPGMNPIGWNYWHLLRIWDLDLNWMVKGQKPGEDAWHRGGFTEKSGYNPDGKGFRGSGVGFGYSDAEVDEMNIDSDVLREYQRQLEVETEEYLASVTVEELGREFPNMARPGEMTSVRGRFQQTIGHSWNHIGELRYAKGILGYPDAANPGTRRQRAHAAREDGTHQ